MVAHDLVFGLKILIERVWVLGKPISVPLDYIFALCRGEIQAALKEHMARLPGGGPLYRRFGPRSVDQGGPLSKVLRAPP